MRKLLFIAFLTIAFTALTNAQNKDNFTYRDLLNQQKIERDELKQTQKEIFAGILDREKAELEKAYSEPDTEKRHQAERENLVKIQTDEREKQMQIQADERKQFIQRPTNIND